MNQLCKWLVLAAILFVAGSSLVAAQMAATGGQILSGKAIIVVGINPPPPPVSGTCPSPAPSPAIAAGLTTCVLAIDFTAPGGFYATLSNWLDVCGAASGATKTLYGIASSLRGSNPTCPQFNIINDSSNGNVQVLDETWNLTYNAAGNQTAAFQTVNSNGTAGLSVKGSYYIQTTFRTTVASYGYSDTVHYPFVTEFWQFANCDDGTINCVDENDIDEIYSFPGSFGDTCGAVSCGSGFTWHQWDDGSFGGTSSAFAAYSGTGGVQNGYDATLYQTVGARITMDGVSNTGVASCAYLSGGRTYSVCSQWRNVTTAEFGAHQFFIFSTGPQGVGGPSGNGDPPVTMDTLWKTIYLWSCPTWNTTGCYNNPVLTTP